MKYEDCGLELRRGRPESLFMARKNGKFGGVWLVMNEAGELIARKYYSLMFPYGGIDVPDFTLTTEDLNADDWFIDGYNQLQLTYEYGDYVKKRNPDNDKYLTAPAYAGRFVGEGRTHKYVYLNMEHIQHLPEHVDEGDLIERGWMKAEPDFQGVAYCRFCGASLKEERYGFLTSTCPKCSRYCGYADFQMCVSC